MKSTKLRKNYLINIIDKEFEIPSSDELIELDFDLAPPAAEKDDE